MSASILVAYYEGAYGPTIRVDSQVWEDLVAIRDVFGRLAASDSEEEEEFCHALACDLKAVEALTLRAVRRRSGKALQRVGEGSKGYPFTWVNTCEDWQECVAKVDGLLEQNRPGHQYLTREGLDDALVEVCYMEERFG